MIDHDVALTLHQAIADALVPEGGVLTRFVIVAEYDDGAARWLITDQSDGLTDWDRSGMLAAAEGIIDEPLP